MVLSVAADHSPTVFRILSLLAPLSLPTLHLTWCPAPACSVYAGHTGVWPPAVFTSLYFTTVHVYMIIFIRISRRNIFSYVASLEPSRKLFSWLMLKNTLAKIKWPVLMPALLFLHQGKRDSLFIPSHPSSVPWSWFLFYSISLIFSEIILNYVN